MKPMGIGIVGAGAIAQRNAREAAASGVARVAGVFDVNHKVARDMAQALSAPFYSSYEELLDGPGVDAVLVSVPHHLHRPLGEQAAAKGKHILMEKPLANSLANAEALIEACERAGVALTVNYSFRYLAKIRKAKEIVEAGALGDVIGVQVVMHQYKDPGYWTGARSNSPDDWRASKEKCGGGFLIMTACHNVDYVHWIAGLRAERVYAEYATLGSSAEVEDIISVSWRLENGAVGTLAASSIMRGTEQGEERIWGTKGTLILDGSGLSVWSARGVDGRRPAKLHRFTKFPEVSWTADWVRGFVRAVQEGRTPEVSPQDGWENQAFLECAYASMEEGRPVRIPEGKGASPRSEA